MGVSDVTFYRWRKLYANLGVAEIRRLKQLEEDNSESRTSSVTVFFSATSVFKVSSA
jgi:hypothetical protein